MNVLFNLQERIGHVDDIDHLVISYFVQWWIIQNNTVLFVCMERVVAENGLFKSYGNCHPQQ